MGNRNAFTEFEIKKLKENPNVDQVLDKSIIYNPEFKLRAVKTRETPATFFVENGFDLNVIGQNTPTECLIRWKRVYHKRGREGLFGTPMKEYINQKFICIKIPPYGLWFEKETYRGRIRGNDMVIRDTMNRQKNFSPHPWDLWYWGRFFKPYRESES